MRFLIVCLAAVSSWAAVNAGRLYRQGLEAERRGDPARAYLLYWLAAAHDPHNRLYWTRALAVRPKAAPAPASPAPAAPDAALAPISEADLIEARRLLPPPQLQLPPGPKTLELRGDARALWRQLARACSIEAVFDGDLQPGPLTRLTLLEADCRQAFRQLETATGTFLIVLGERLVLVAKDTPQKRAELEPHVAVTIPIPPPVSLQEFQELARAVQQTMELSKVGFDSQRRLVLLRDRVSKVRPAQLLLEQLLTYRPQVLVELRMIEVDRSVLVSYGWLWPTDWPFFNFARIGQSRASLPAAAARGLLFGGGRSLFGIGVGDAELFARLTEISARTLLEAELRSLAGQAASFHVGDQYPVMTAGYFGYTGGLQAFTPPPSFQFADLGLVLKFTPYVHGPQEVTLDLEAEFKLLAGQSVNGIPLLSNRRLASKVRLNSGDWAVVAGLMNSAEARTIRGLAGLSRLPLLGPLFRRHELSRDSNEVLILLKPRVIALPPADTLARGLWVGTEGRLLGPL